MSDAPDDNDWVDTVAPTTYVLDAKLMTTKATLFDECQRVLRFPEYFGRNWDALDECLRDLDWLEYPLQRLVIVDASELLVDGDDDDLATFLAIIRDASNDADFTVALHRPDSRVWQAAAGG